MKDHSDGSRRSRGLKSEVHYRQTKNLDVDDGVAGGGDGAVVGVAAAVVDDVVAAAESCFVTLASSRPPKPVDSTQMDRSPSLLHRKELVNHSISPPNLDQMDPKTMKAIPF